MLSPPGCGRAAKVIAQQQRGARAVASDDRVSPTERISRSFPQPLSSALPNMTESSCPALTRGAGSKVIRAMDSREVQEELPLLQRLQRNREPKPGDEQIV